MKHLLVEKFVWANRMVDPNTIRVLLAWASLAWTWGAWTNPVTFTRFPYNALEHLGFGLVSPVGWGALFLLHAIGVGWRVVAKESVFWGLVVNIYGFVLWTSVTATLSWVAGGLSVGVATDWSFCLFAGWALVGTRKGQTVSA